MYLRKNQPGFTCQNKHIKFSSGVIEIKQLGPLIYLDPLLRVLIVKLDTLNNVHISRYQMLEKINVVCFLCVEWESERKEIVFVHFFTRVLPSTPISDSVAKSRLPRQGSSLAQKK